MNILIFICTQTLSHYIYIYIYQNSQMDRYLNVTGKNIANVFHFPCMECLQNQVPYHKLCLINKQFHIRYKSTHQHLIIKVQSMINN